MAPTATAPAERTLPHNLDAERSVLGAILLHNDAFNAAAEVIDSNHFFRDAHRRIFDKMVKLAERGDAIDLVTLKEELTRAGEIDEVGGPAYLAALVDGVPRSTNVEHYARIVKEKATLRNLIFSANKILGMAYDGEEEADLILDQAEHAIFAIADEKVRDGFVSMRTLAQTSMETIEQLHARKELITGVPTGFTDLDEMTSGLQAGDLVIIAARPSMGKTSLVLNMAQHVGTKTDKSVGIFSLEMSKEQLFLRMLTAEARIDAHRLRGGFLGDKDWGRLSQALGTLSEAKVFIDDSASIGVLEMRAKCRRLQSEHGLHMVVVDYIQLMQGRGRFENRTLELASISRSMKGLAKELSVPIVVLSQLSRAPESRSDHRPQLSDLRESGALEQDADVVMFIYREDVYADKNAPPTDAQGTAELIIGKQRNGPTGVVKLAFIREFTRFENLAPGYQLIRPTVARVNLGALASNYRRIVEFVGAGRADEKRPSPRIIAVVKANVYGHGAVQVARALEAAGADLLACADIEEGAALRAGGVTAEILVFGALSVSDLDGLFDCRLTPTISTPGAARAVQQAAAQHRQRVRYHLKIDTGMNRLGFRFDNLGRTLPELLASDHLELAAIYTHLATADVPESPLLDQQRVRFEHALEEIGALRRTARGASNGQNPYVHAANSAGLLRDSRVWFDAVRPGLLLYGVVPPPLASTLDLAPVMSLGSRVVAVKGMRPGESSGYGARFTATRPTTLAVIPAGYADGLDLRLAGQGVVLIRGKRAPVVGSVCMDMLMADVTGLDVSPGDEVVIIGAQGNDTIDAREMAATIGSIPWEILCRVGSRIERVYGDG